MPLQLTWVSKILCMKKVNLVSKITVITIVGVIMTLGSCRKNLLSVEPPSELPANVFWKTESDATSALMGCYASIRPLFDRDYYFDGQSEYVRDRSGTNSATSGNLRLGDAYHNANYNPTGYGAAFDKMWRYLYGGVNRANYVIENVQKMLPEANPTSIANLEAIIGEAKLLRGMVYFRLISMWGDVPYITKVINDNSEVVDLPRLPLKQIKDSIMLDFDYAAAKLPNKGSALGRAGKPAALAFRGKLQLYWACWNKFGWPELEGFQPNAAAADLAYNAAAADFRSVINDFGLTLYANGDPGGIDSLGKADILPNYYYLFNPKTGNGSSEMIMVFTHGGTGTNQGEELMRDFSGRSHEGSQCWVSPRYEIADRYQLLSTGDFAPPMTLINPTNNPAARTTPNAAVNPQSYAGRDYRMKSTIQWDYEMSVGLSSLQSTGMVPFIYQNYAGQVTINGVKYIT